MLDNKNNGPVEVDENGNPIPRKSKQPQPIKFDFDFAKLIKKGFFPILILLLIVGYLATGTYTVNEMEQAMIVRFGSIQKVIVSKDADIVKAQLSATDQFKGVKVIQGKGLFFKVPFIDQVEKYTSQLLTYKTLPGEVTTLDKKKIVLDNNAQWRIVNPALFKISMVTIDDANNKLDDLIFSGLREQIGKTDGTTLISDKEFVYSLTSLVKDQVNEQVYESGIEVFDVRIAKTEFPDQNNANIFTRMRTERQKIANKLRAEGDEQYQIITAKADKEATILKAEAYATAEENRGQGDAEALAIYASAYNKDPEFYQFLKTLETYKESLGSNAKIVIDSDSEFAKYLFQINAPSVTVE